MLDQPTAFFLVFNSVVFNTKIEIVSETQFMVKIPKRDVRNSKKLA